MALFKIHKGPAANLGASGNITAVAHEGFAYFTPDDGKFYIDIQDANEAVVGVNRIPINSVKADKFSSDRTITITGSDITGTGTSNGTSGWSIAASLIDRPGLEAGSYGLANNDSPGYSGTFKVPYFTIDAKGRVTAASEYTITLPAAVENSHYITHLYAGTGTAANAATTNGNTKLTLTDNAAVRNTITLKGSNAIDVSSDNKGVISISNSGVRNITTGTANGTINVNINGTNTDIAIAGLGDRAFDSTKYWALSGSDGQFIENESFNNKTTIGNYYISATAIADTIPDEGKPGTGTIYGTLKVSKIFNLTTNANYLRQDWFKHNSAQHFIRRTNGNAEWSGWSAYAYIPPDATTQKPIAVGSTSQPVYVKSSGEIAAITGAIANDTTGNANTATAFASDATISLTGDITGSSNGTHGWSINTTIGTSKVTNAMLAGSITNNKLVNSTIGIAGTNIALGSNIDKATLLSNLGLTNAVHYIGKATKELTDGGTENPTISGYDFANDRKSGDIVLGKDGDKEYIWGLNGWELLGPVDTIQTSTGTGTQNRMAYYSAANMISSSSHYTTDTTVAINKTSITDGYNFEVNGNSIYDGNIRLNNTVLERLITSKVVDGIGWSRNIITLLDKEGTLFARFGAYGNANDFKYIFIGTGAYNSEDNLRIYAAADGQSEKIAIGRTVTTAAAATLYVKGTPGEFTFRDRKITPVAIFDGQTYFAGGLNSASYISTNVTNASTAKNISGDGSYYLYGNNVQYGRLYIASMGLAPTENEGTYSGANAGHARLILGNNKINANSVEGEADNAYGDILLYRNNGSYAVYEPAAIYYQNNLENADVFSYQGSKSTTANEDAYATWVLGNSVNKTSTSAHSEGRLRIYSASTGYHQIVGTSTTGARVHYFPNASGWIVTGGNGSDTGVGDTSKPVYIDTNGVAKPISYTIEKSVPNNALFTDTTYTISTGDNNGQIKVTPSTGSAYNVDVKGFNNVVYHTDELLPPNFAPLAFTQPYISRIDNGLYAANKRWVVTTTNAASSVSNLFDGNYESQFQISANTTATVIIDFSNGNANTYYPDYPYGYFLISCYNGASPSEITGQVYCNYAAQGVGWHDLAFTKITDGGSKVVFKSDHNGYYQISQLKITIVNNTSALARLTQLELHLDRPSADSAIISKYKAEKLYYDLTAPNFIGNLSGTATKATQDESGNNIKATYAASFSISDHTITLKNKNGGSLGAITVPDNDTKNTAGATDTNSKIYLIGATEQTANPQTYSDNEVFVTSGVLTAKEFIGAGNNITLNTANRLVYTDVNKKLAVTNIYTNENTIRFLTTTDTRLLENQYNSINYPLIRNHNNGNISISASSGGLYLGYENTQFTNISNRVKIYPVHTFRESTAISEPGWIRIASLQLNDNNHFGQAVLDFTITRSYSSGAPETYTIRVTAGWQTCTLTQLGGSIKVQRFTEFRVVVDNTIHKAYFEIYLNTTPSNNTIYISTIDYTNKTTLEFLSEPETKLDSELVLYKVIKLKTAAISSNKSLYISDIKQGLFLTDSSNSLYGAIFNNDSNLWIGATAINENIHTGKLYLHAGKDANGIINKSVYIGIQGDTNTTTINKPIAYGTGGSNIKPVYVDSDGLVNPISYTIEKSVPSNALFTDTWTALSTSAAGYVSQAPNDTHKFLRGDAAWAEITSAKSTTLAWNTESTIATVGGYNIKVTLPANPVNDLDVAAVGGETGEYISKISETNGKISATKATTTVSNTWVAGTTAGPAIKTTVNGITGTAVAIPSASATASGAVTTGTQEFKGLKTIRYTEGNYNYNKGDNTSKFYKIKINSTTSWMLTFTIRVYHNYNWNDIVISGYNYPNDSTNRNWYQAKAVMLGGNHNNEINVYFGKDANNSLWIGLQADKYTGLDIFQVTNGYTQITDIAELFTITLVDSLEGEQISNSPIKVKRPVHKGETITYAPAGTVSKPTITLTPTTNKIHVQQNANTPALAMSVDETTETLSFSWNVREVSVWTNASATSSTPTFTGTQATITI